jgi:uncharacterized protein (DUF1684 family)
MKKIIVLIALTMSICLNATAQSYTEDIRRWQQHYKAEFLTDPRSPVKEKDTAYIRFFLVNSEWNVPAKVTLTPEAKAFDMATHSGKTKRFRPFVGLHFIDPASKSLRYFTLIAYERVDRPASDTDAARTLFIPFQDLTNGDETYGGGRYIDLMKADVKGGQIMLDFNKAYNPYCAFGEGFSCPIPPVENRLKLYIRAGEKMPVPPLLPKE